MKSRPYLCFWFDGKARDRFSSKLKLLLLLKRIDYSRTLYRENLQCIDVAFVDQLNFTNNPFLYFFADFCLLFLKTRKNPIFSI